MNTAKFERLLIIKLSSLGDVLHTLPFVAAIRHSNPKARIVWVVHPSFSGLIPGAPWVDRVIEFPRPSLAHPIRSFSNLLKLRRALKAEHFDLSVDLQGLFKSAIVALVSGSKKRLGTAFMREASGWISRPIRGDHATGHAVERSLDVARFLGAEVSEPEYPLPDISEPTRAVRKFLSASGLKENAPYVVFAIGARWVTKCWPAEHFADLAGKFLDDGVNVVLTGSVSDRSISEKIVAMANQSRFCSRSQSESNPDDSTGILTDLTGETSLLELLALIKGSALFVSGDTGPLHIAVSAQVPLVSLFGPTRPGRTGPYGNKKASILITPLECGGCLKRKCGHCQCLAAITPNDVYSICRQKLRENDLSEVAVSGNDQ